MKILVIGGTRFVGKHFVEAAVARGHEVMLFNRGNNPVPEGVVESITGDRNEDLGLLEGGDWDAVLDTSAYVPRQVREAADILSPLARHYTFISTISVYADHSKPLQDESAPVIELEDPTVEEIRGDTYGGLKVLCERALAESFAGDTLVVRPGLIVGPDDPTDRFTYWPVRVAQGGEVLAPRGPDMPVQWIDVRDLAAWLLESMERKLTGTFNAISEPDRFDLGELLTAAKEASASDARFTWVDEEFLLEREVQPFMGLPLWIPGDDINFSRLDNSRARAQGLKARPVSDTVMATLEWHRSAPQRPLKAGLTREREEELLRAWRERTGGSSGTGS